MSNQQNKPPPQHTREKFTPQQRLSLAVACAVFDEGMVLMKGPQLGCSDPEARSFLEELTQRVRDRLAQNKDFVAAAPDLLEALEMCVGLAECDAQDAHGNPEAQRQSDERLDKVLAAIAKAKGAT